MTVFLHVAAPPQPSYDTVGPGTAGFIAIFLLALATVVLIRSMVGHLRKVRYGPGPGGDGKAEVGSDGPTPGQPPTNDASSTRTRQPPGSDGPST